MNIDLNKLDEVRNLLIEENHLSKRLEQIKRIRGDHFTSVEITIKTNSNSKKEHIEIDDYKHDKHLPVQIVNALENVLNERKKKILADIEAL